MANPLKDLTPWQETLLGGLKNGTITMTYSQRHAGKSVLNEYLRMLQNKARFEVIDKGLVDDRQWYVVRCPDRNISAWIRSQPEEQWYEHIDQRGYIDMNIFDLHEELYAMLKLRWS